MWMKQRLKSKPESSDQARKRIGKKVLKRFVQVFGGGLDTEAHQRHANIIVESLNLEEVIGVNSPCEEGSGWEAEENRIV